MRLPPRPQREFSFILAYARYGGVPAASPAQLSLIGWGHNQFWDGVAIARGDDPSRQNGGEIADVSAFPSGSRSGPAHSGVTAFRAQ